MNEYGEPIDEFEAELEVKVYAPNTSIQVFNNDRMNSTVLAYRLDKRPDKLSDFERCALDGTKWVRRLSQRKPAPTAHSEGEG